MPDPANAQPKGGIKVTLSAVADTIDPATITGDEVATMAKVIASNIELLFVTNLERENMRSFLAGERTIEVYVGMFTKEEA